MFSKFHHDSGTRNILPFKIRRQKVNLCFTYIVACFFAQQQFIVRNIPNNFFLRKNKIYQGLLTYE